MMDNLAAPPTAAVEGDDLTFNRGWNAAKAEITAALGCDWEGIYLAAKEPWALKVAQLVETAKAEGAAEYLEDWARDRRRVLSDQKTIWACDPQEAENFAVDLERRAAAIRKGIEGRAGGGR